MRRKGEKHSGWVFGNLAQKAKNKFEPGRRNSSFVLGVSIQRKIAVIFLFNLVIVRFSAQVEAKAEAIFAKTLPTFYD